MITVLIADHSLTGLHEQLRARLTPPCGIKLTGPVRSFKDTLTRLASSAPDILLVDWRLLGPNWLANLDQLVERCQKTKILLIKTPRIDEYALDVLKRDVKGYLLDTESCAENCMKAIQAVQRGEYWIGRECLGRVLASLIAEKKDLGAQAVDKILTVREHQIVHLVSKGLTNKEIAVTLKISDRTVKVHLSAIFQKLGVHRRAGLAHLDHLSPLLNRPGFPGDH